MPFIAIIGAGPLGSSLAHKLAQRQRAREIRLIDPGDAIARGKALDIQQSGPVEGFDSVVSAYSSVHAAVGADSIVIADAVTGAEHGGEAGLSLLRQIDASGSTCPIVFAGSSQRELMMRAVTELHLPPERVVGSAPVALVSTMRALAAVVLDASAVDISLNVVGVPPRDAVIAWQEASVAGQPLTSAMAAHDMAALSARVPGLWPPGPYALASAAARVTEAVCLGSRRQFSCLVDVGRGRITAMPVELKAGGIKRIIEPSLTAQERTALENAAHKAMRSR
jgi:malate dehydrogenase